MVKTLALFFAALCVAVISGSAQDQNFAIASYNLNGSLDVNFGNQGRVATTFSIPGGSQLNDLVIDGNKIIAAGKAGSAMALARYNSDGTLDCTFGSDGRVLLGMPFSDEPLEAQAVTLKNDKIIVAGTLGQEYGSRSMVVARINKDGTREPWIFPSFAPSACIESEARAVAVDSQNRIVVGGSAVCAHPDFSMPLPHLALARFHWDGSPDLTFGNNGTVVQTIHTSLDKSAYASYTRMNDLVVDGNGRIVVTGQWIFQPYQNNSLMGEFAIVRFLADGKVDTSFSAPDGWAFPPGEILPLEAPFVRPRGWAVTLQADGRILAAGSTVRKWMGNSLNRQFAVVRLLDNGNFDPSFSDDGKAIAPFSLNPPWQADAEATSIFYAGQTLLAAGWTGPSDGERFALASFLPDGSLVPTFGNQGMVVTDFTCSGWERASGIRLRPAPTPFGYRIIVGGTARGLPCDGSRVPASPPPAPVCRVP